MKAAKGTLATMTVRAREALAAQNDPLASQAAEAIATMENECALRREIAARLEQKVLRLRGSVETAHRRIIDLKQGAISVRAVRREQDMQMRLNTTLSGNSTADKAEDLIARVLGRNGPLEEAEILKGINDDLNHDGFDARMEAAGFGPDTRTTAASVLNRLKTEVA